jgi:uncharacterized membrane protein
MGGREGNSAWSSWRERRHCPGDQNVRNNIAALTKVGRPTAIRNRSLRRARLESMATIVEKTVEIAAPVEDVFAYVDDFTNTQSWMYGLDKIEPVTDEVRGVGAEYDGVMKVGITLTSRIKCTVWEENRRIELTSVKGIRNTQRWTFTALGKNRTRVDAWISYSLPGGPAGATMAAAIKPFVGIAVRHTSETLVKNVEALKG